MRSGLVAATVLNAQRSDEKQKVWTWTDFFPDAAEQTQERDPEQIIWELDHAAKVLKRQGGRRS